MLQITIYTKDFCPYCTAAKDFFTTLGVEYTEKDIRDPQHQDEHMKLVEEYNHRTIPMILINDECIGGYDDLMVLHKEGTVKEMLGME